MAVDNGSASNNAVITFPPLANFGVECHLGHSAQPDTATLNPNGPASSPFVDPQISTTLQTQVNKSNWVSGIGLVFINPA